METSGHFWEFFLSFFTYVCTRARARTRTRTRAHTRAETENFWNCWKNLNCLKNCNNSNNSNNLCNSGIILGNCVYCTYKYECWIILCFLNFWYYFNNSVCLPNLLIADIVCTSCYCMNSLHNSELFVIV